MLLYVLKVTLSAATIAVVALWESGDCLLGLLAVPMLLTMWYAIRLHARRRAPPGVRQ